MQEGMKLFKRLIRLFLAFVVVNLGISQANEADIAPIVCLNLVSGSLELASNFINSKASIDPRCSLVEPLPDHHAANCELMVQLYRQDKTWTTTTLVGSAEVVSGPADIFDFFTAGTTRMMKNDFVRREAQGHSLRQIDEQLAKLMESFPSCNMLPSVQ